MSVPGGEADAAVEAFLAGFHRASASRLFRIDGVLWRTVGTSTVMSTPAALIQDVGRGQIDRVLRESGCSVAQFVTAEPTGVVTRHHVLRDAGYSAASLQRQFRQMLRRAEARLTFRPLEWGEIADAAPPVIDASRARVGKATPIDRDLWRAACDAGRGSSRLRVFGCLLDGSLLGCAIFVQNGGGFWAVNFAARPERLDLGVANLLLHHSARRLICEDGCRFVSFGHSGLPERESVSRFKRHGGLTEETLRVATVLHPRWRWIGTLERSTGCFSRLRSLVGPGSRWGRPLLGITAAAATDASRFTDGPPRSDPPSPRS